MSKLSLTRSILMDFKLSGAPGFDIIRLHQRVQDILRKWVLQDTIRKYADDLLWDEFPTVKDGLGKRKFIGEPTQGVML